MTPHDAILTTLSPLTGPDDTRVVVDFIADAELALLGEASHGTHEFYASRAHITKHLILESGFRAVVVEADWPDAYRVNRYVRHQSRDARAVEALDDFKRFPTWMWRNTDVVAFIEWLREHNEGLPSRQQAGFYGMDLYALHSSMRAVLGYLQTRDPEAAQRAMREPDASAKLVVWAHNSHLGDARATQMGQCGELNVGQLMRERFPGNLPETERQSHYFHASLSSQFDAVAHFDHTSAVRPLEVTAQWTIPEVPETFPTGV